MGRMNRRTLLRLSLAPLLLDAARAFAQPAFHPTPQDQADLQRIETYLDGLRSMKAHFLQVAPNGAITQGEAWLERPGRMRFQYDPPSPLLLVAGHGLVVFNDKSLNQTSNIPIGRTPLGILLADHVHLSGDVTVTDMQHLPGTDPGLPWCVPPPRGWHAHACVLRQSADAAPVDGARRTAAGNPGYIV